MAWHCYFEYAGAEIINAERVEAYMAQAKVSWFRPVYETVAMSTLFGVTYEDPFTDEAPWGDPDDPDSYNFWGVYPLNITGIEDSTRTAQITENINDGGSIGPLRNTTRAMVFEVALFGATECANESGFRWLKNALLPTPCDGLYQGTELCYFACEPCKPADCDTPEEAAECSRENTRTLRNVKVISGPTITARRTMSDGAAMWTATFTAVAGVPFEFGPDIPLVEGFMVAPQPWVPDVIPADWAFDVTAENYVDANCAETIYEPIVDPLCVAVESPPLPPAIPVGCFTPPESWARRWFTVPRKYVPYWGDVVTTVRIQAQAQAVRNLRLRFYSDVDANASVLEDPCAYCGDILFSYVPPDHTLVLDGVTQTVYAEGPGGTSRRADSLIYKTDGTPFDWPLLTCGFGYVVAVDLPSTHTGALPSVDLSVTARAA